MADMGGTSLSARQVSVVRRWLCRRRQFARTHHIALWGIGRIALLVGILGGILTAIFVR
jgi:hypothetical protein